MDSVKMHVIKRDGRKEPVSFDKITNRISFLLYGILKDKIDPTIITQKIADRIKDGITTTEIDEMTAIICVTMSINNYYYGILAARISIDCHQKNTIASPVAIYSILYKNRDTNGEHNPLVSDKIYDLAHTYSSQLEGMIVHNRDFNIDYFGFKTLQKSYLMKSGGKIIERPQHMWLRVALQLHGNDMDSVKRTYDFLSLGYFIHATPTLYHSGSIYPQLASCFLAGTEDSIEGIYKTISDCAKISKWAGGIGIHISNIRSKHSYIRKTNGYSTGIIPMLRVYNDTARYVNQSGKRFGSFAVYLEPHHPDIFDFLYAMRKNGSEELRARDLFYGLWISDLFMEAVETDSEWYLMDPDVCPGLTDVYGDNFKELYNSYISSNKYSKKVKAREIWEEIFTSQIETGMPYICYKDSVNLKSNHKNIGTIKSSNLCVSGSTKILTDMGYIRIKNFVEGKVSVRKFNDKDSFITGKYAKVWNGKEFSTALFGKTGDNRRILKIGFSNGMYIKCTDNHIFYMDDEKTKKTACELRIGMRLIKYTLPVIKYNPYREEGIFHPSTVIYSKTIDNKIYNKYFEDKILFINQILRDNKCEIVNYGKTCENNLRRLIINSDDRKANKKILLTFSTLGIHAFINDKFVDISHMDYINKLLIYDEIKKNNYTFPEINEPKSIDPDFYDNLRVTYIREYSYENTYCFNEPNEHMGIFNGILTGNCTEIMEYSDYKEYSVCNLASISLAKFITSPNYSFFKNKSIKIYTIPDCGYCALIKALFKEYNIQYILESLDDVESKSKFLENNPIKTFPQINIEGEEKIFTYTEIKNILLPKIDHEKLKEVVYQVTINLDLIIDQNYYPVEESKISNMNNRPIGIGVQGLADLFNILKVPFDSNEAKIINREMFETMYYASLLASNDLAKIKGPYPRFKGSPISEGLLQFDLWDKYSKNNSLTVLNGRWDFDTLRKNIITYGVRNSLLISPMPTATTSQILGNNEAFEPFTSNIYSRRTMAGEFPLINKHLVRDLENLGLYTPEMITSIIKNRGSVQINDNPFTQIFSKIPKLLRDVYKSVWEIPQKVLLDLCIERSRFIDQSSSMNIYMKNPTLSKMTSMHFYGWKNGLKTGSYYIRTESAVKAQQFSVEIEEKPIQNAYDNICESCSG